MTLASDENQEYILKIGSKGEIFTPKAIRDKLGFNKGDTIIVTIHQGNLIIRPVKSLEELLEEPAKKTISYHAWKEFRANLSKEAEE